MIQYTTKHVGYLRALFNKYNEELFEGVLKPIPFKFKNIEYVGHFKCEVFNNSSYINRVIVPLEICISTKYLLSEQQLKNTLVHEMIHYYDSVCNPTTYGRKEHDGHGDFFREQMERINALDNDINISVHVRISKVAGVVCKNHDKEVDAVFFKWNDGTFGMVLPSKSILHGTIEKYNDLFYSELVTELYWTKVVKGDFMTHKQHRTLRKYYPITESTFLKYMEQKNLILSKGIE